MEEAILDIVGDEQDDFAQKQRMMRWDKARRKYVQTTFGSELSGDSKSKKLRLESGKLIKRDKIKLGDIESLTDNVNEMYDSAPLQSMLRREVNASTEATR
jgi:hypothetical protein